MCMHIHMLSHTHAQRGFLSGPDLPLICSPPPNRIIVANVGDSLAVLSRKGKAEELTVPHRVYGPGVCVSVPGSAWV